MSDTGQLFFERDCVKQPNTSGVAVSDTDVKFFPALRGFVKRFMESARKAPSAHVR